MKKEKRRFNKNLTYKLFNWCMFVLYAFVIGIILSWLFTQVHESEISSIQKDYLKEKNQIELFKLKYHSEDIISECIRGCQIVMHKIMSSPTYAINDVNSYSCAEYCLGVE
jgi:hypothetical protein